MSESKHTPRELIVRSDFTGVYVGYYRQNPTSIGPLQSFSKLCQFIGDILEAEKQATRMIQCWNEYDQLKALNRELAEALDRVSLVYFNEYAINNPDPGHTGKHDAYNKAQKALAKYNSTL